MNPLSRLVLAAGCFVCLTLSVWPPFVETVVTKGGLEVIRTITTTPEGHWRFDSHDSGYQDSADKHRWIEHRIDLPLLAVYWGMALSLTGLGVVITWRRAPIGAPPTVTPPKEAEQGLPVEALAARRKSFDLMAGV